MTTPTKILTDEQREDLYNTYFDDVFTDGEDADAIIKAIEQAVLQSPEVQARQWQPIETAPKDGTHIMLSDGTSVTVGHWLYQPGGTTEYRDLDGRWIGQDDRDEFAGWIDWMGGITPTHWMPLPAPPSDAMQEQKP